MACIAILGMGPVGLATAWDLIQRQHDVHIFDINTRLVNECRTGKFSRVPQIEKDLAAAIGNSLHLHDKVTDLSDFDALAICVGTPPSKSGFDLRPLLQSLKTVSELQFQRCDRHVILRSTLMPNTIENEFLPAIRSQLGWNLGREFSLSYFPEFLREKFVRDDLIDPPLRIAAHSSAETAFRFSVLFPHTNRAVDFATAETLKLACNAFHALKVTFANEMAGVCAAAGVDSGELMALFCEDTKLNISANYLRPGAPFGGPCLGKDLNALETFIQRNDLNGKILGAIRSSNDAHAELCANAEQLAENNTSSIRAL